MADLIYAPLSRPTQKKGSTAKRIAKRKRAEGPVIKAVRAQCVERDGYCRIGSLTADALGDYFAEELFVPALADGCSGPSEWSHIKDTSRAKTRNMKPEVRHRTAKSLMLCKYHHDCYDGRQRPRLLIEEPTELGADGPLYFSQEEA